MPHRTAPQPAPEFNPPADHKLLVPGVYYGDHLIGGERFLFAVGPDGNELMRLPYDSDADGRTAWDVLHRLVQSFGHTSPRPPPVRRALALVR
jgi:hypothetical protein